MLKLAALAMAAASTTSTPALVANAPWWEKVTVTIAADGQPSACQYQASHGGSAASECDVADAPAEVRAKAAKSTGANDQLTKITFERRFIPGGTRPAKPNLQPGDTLLGGQVMALAIDSAGAVQGCRVVAKAGSVTPDYGCDEATAEKFQASTGQTASPQGFMTVLVYGHQENLA